MTKGAGLSRRSCAGGACPRRDTARQSPPAALSACVPTPPISARPAAARLRPSSPAPSPRARLSGTPRKPGTGSILHVIHPERRDKLPEGGNVL